VLDLEHAEGVTERTDGKATLEHAASRPDAKLSIEGVERYHADERADATNKSWARFRRRLGRGGPVDDGDRDLDVS
jgi:hypothetical protein